MKSLIFTSMILFLVVITSPAHAEQSKLSGEWSGPAKMLLNTDGTGQIVSGLCSFGIEWSATKTTLTFHYVKEPECSYDDAQIGNVSQKRKKPANDDTVKYEINKSDEMGFDSMELTLYSRTAPQGAKYYRPLTKAERGNSAGAGMSKQECKKEMADQTRECDQQGGEELEIMLCKNKVIMNHLDCM